MAKGQNDAPLTVAKAALDKLATAADADKPAALNEARAAVDQLAGISARSLEALARMVARQNPYTAGELDDMDLHIGHPHPAGWLPAAGAPPVVPGSDDSQIEIEVDGDYPGTWEFKGVPQKLNRVLRIKYRCKVRQKDGAGNQRSGDPVLYWMTAYLLVGFEDGGA